ncbi:type II toxin-antitoxin system VapC family toxin [Brucella pituitosa]|uniref:type II toxin-antitoxin system VapC family toxin n=1 Tax=Brucella pituitosa TaxID=571256 RepID=UPI0009A259CB|nr:type II toxin-antitoxin system VapC family toxin [Brucella pituitosa]
MSFVDASIIVAILNEEPGYQEIEKRLNEEKKRLYVSPLVRFEATMAIARISIEAAKGKVDRSAIIVEAKAIVDEIIDVLDAEDISIDAKVGNLATEAAIQYGKVAGHKAKLNFGDCFAYAAAKAYRLSLLYKGNDFAETDLA